MATCRSRIKCLKSTCEIVSYCVGGWNSATCTRNKMLYKRGFLKNFWKFWNKYKEQSSGGVQSKDVLKIHRKNIFARVSILTKLQAGNFKLVEAAAGDLSQSVKQVALKNFANITGKNLCWSLFSIKVEFWGPATLLKKTPTQVFLVKFTKFLRTIILKNICERLLLNIRCFPVNFVNYSRTPVF